MDTDIALLLFFPLGYLIGSVPFGLVLCKLFGYGDIRKIGSGNIGATNVLRTGNKPLAALVLALDTGKGALAVLAYVAFIASMESAGETTAIPYSHTLGIGLGAVLGHIFPVWLKFKGGKGVATTLGTLLAAAPYAGLIACGTWLLTALIFRISSLSALAAMAAAPVAAFVLYGPLPAFATLLIALVVWVRHKDNIKRLLKGEEPKIGGNKT